MCAIAVFKEGLHPAHLPGVIVLCALGILTCVVGCIGVTVTQNAFTFLLKSYGEGNGLPPLVSPKHLHFIGKMLPYTVLVIFIVAWIALLWLTVRS